MSTIFIEPVDNHEYQQTLIKHLTAKRKRKILQFARAQFQFVNAIENNGKLLEILVAELNEIGPSHSKAEYLNAIKAWKLLVHSDEANLTTDDKSLGQIIIEECEWFEPTDEQIKYVFEQLKSKTDSDKVWPKISAKLNHSCRNKKSISFWKQCFVRFEKQLKARKELIHELRGKYEEVPLSLSKLEKQLLKYFYIDDQIHTECLKSYCRICLAPNSQEMLPLFVDNVKDGDECSLLDKLIFCCCLKKIPQSNDNLPQYICLSCSILLENSYQFRNLCIKTENKLQEIFNHGTKLQIQILSDELLNSKEDTNTAIQDVDFVDCTETSCTENKIKDNVQNAQDKQHLCEECGKFQRKKSLNNHRTAHSDERRYACKICGKRFKTTSSLKNHRAVHTSTKDFQCSTCSFTTNTKSNLRVHERIHSDVQAYPCKCCELKFKTASNLMKHLRNVHEKQRTYKCDLCKSSYFSRDGLRRHEVAHTGKRPFYCPAQTCSTTYLWYSGLRKHIQLLHADENIKIPTEKSYLDQFDENKRLA